jgi:glutaredoxin
MDSEQQPAARTCQKHGLVLDPSGQCVLCRRERGEPPEASGSDHSGLVKLGLLLLALGATGAAVFYLARSTREPPPVTVQMAPPPTVPVVEPDPGDEIALAREEALARVRAQDAEERLAKVRKRMHEIEVQIYTTKACTLCPAAIAYLKEGGYTFKELDVEKSPEDLATLRKINPQVSVPTLVVADEVLVGYGPQLVVNALRRAAEKQVR